MRYLFFSCESEPPAGYYFTKLMCPVGETFNRRFPKERYSLMLDNISIIPMCITEESLSRMDRKERKYVTIKKRYADIRLKMNFLEFVQGHDDHKVQMCFDVIKKSADYIKSKVSDFQKELFISDLLQVINEIYPQVDIVR